MDSGGGQVAVTTGPTIAAAEAAAKAQMNAAQLAAQTAQSSTDAAIKALLGSQNTSLGLTQPIRTQGNRAAAQLNYLLGLQAAAPGTAPTAPTMPTLSDLASKVTEDQIKNYIYQNSTYNQYAPGAGQSQGYLYQGAGADQFNNYVPWGDEFSGMRPVTEIGALNDAIRNAIAQQGFEGKENEYENAMIQYQQQLDAYNSAQEIYNEFNAKGVASPEDIQNIITQLPGYGAQMNQGINAIQNAASAKGMLNSGNTLLALQDWGQGLASTYYNNYANQLSNLANMGQGATQQAAQQAGQTGSTYAGLLQQLGETVGNSQLAAGSAQASSYLTPAAYQDVRTTNLGGGGSGLLGGLNLGLGIAGLGTGKGATLGGSLLSKLF